MNSSPDIIITDDQSATLVSPYHGEHYHSIKGALTESLHVYIGCGYLHTNTSARHVLEIGFGTGLNALLTLAQADTDLIPTHYHTIELYPLSVKQTEHLGYATHYPKYTDIYRLMHSSSWGEETSLSPHFTLTKHHADITTYNYPNDYFDVVYYDAFSPENQPELWSDAMFARMYRCMRQGGVLTTYCAKGIVRRAMQAAGFTVERLAGPPNGKREILRGTK